MKVLNVGKTQFPKSSETSFWAGHLFHLAGASKPLQSKAGFSPNSFYPLQLLVYSLDMPIGIL